MRWKLAAVAAGLFVGLVASGAGMQAGGRAQDKPAGQRFEYKVVFSPVAHVEVREARRIDGEIKEVVLGPKASAEAMTKQFNALAAEGWEYIGPVAPTGRQGSGDLAGGVLTVFKRAKR